MKMITLFIISLLCGAGAFFICVCLDVLSSYRATDPIGSGWARLFHYGCSFVVGAVTFAIVFALQHKGTKIGTTILVSLIPVVLFSVIIVGSYFHREHSNNMFYKLLGRGNSEQEKQYRIENNRVYEIWATMTVSPSEEAFKTAMRTGEDIGGLSPDYDLIEALPLNYKKIIAYCTLKAGYISNSKDTLLAQALGQYGTLKEAQDSLLKDWKYFEILIDDYYIHCLEIMRSGNKVVILLPGDEPFLRDIHIFDIDKSNEIIYLGYAEGIKYNRPYDETVEIGNLKLKK